MGMSCSVFASHWNSGFTYITAAGWTMTPPLVAHVSVALKRGSAYVLVAGHRYLDFYAKLPFYANMFSDAGFQVTTDQTVHDALVDSLVISGNEATVTARFTELLAAGLDELNDPYCL